LKQKAEDIQTQGHLTQTRPAQLYKNPVLLKKINKMKEAQIIDRAAK